MARRGGGTASSRRHGRYLKPCHDGLTANVLHKMTARRPLGCREASRIETGPESGMSVVLELEKEITGLKELFKFRNVAIVEDYLKRNYTLIETLLWAYLEIKKRFGFDPQICLEVITDPETPEFEQLVAFIRTTMNAEDAFDALTSLEEEWWLGHATFTTGLLCIHLECV